jgi:putative addiction module component (TIGR02574 family)
MVNQAVLAQVRALPPEEQWELVDALLEKLDVPHTDAELAQALEGLRQYRANPEDVVPWDEAMAEIRRRYA